MTDPADPDQVGGALLDYVRDKLEAPELAFAKQPQPIFGGNRTFVYGFRLTNAPEAYQGPLILRILRSFEDAGSASLEASVQSALVSMDYPAPRMLHWSTDSDPLGGAFQVMVRIAGSSLVLADPPEEMTARSLLTQLLPEFRRLLFGPWPRVLAQLQLALHQLDVDAFLEKLAADGFSRDRLSLAGRVEHFAGMVERHAIDGLRPGIGWLSDNLPDADPAAVCHGDFFPNQVLMHGGRVSGVIDWGDTMIAPPELDVGIVKTGLETLPAPLGRPGTALQRWLARKFVGAYEEKRPLDPSRLQYGEAYRCLHVLLVTAERRLAAAGQIDANPGPNPYDNPVGEARLITRFHELTQTRLSIPGPSQIA